MTGEAAGGTPDRDASYLTLLHTLRTSSASLPAGEEGPDLGVVRRIAAWIDSGRVVELICAHPRWYDDWETKESLLRNDATPARWKQDLERAVAIFDLLRELDDASVSAEEKAEVQEDIRHLFKTLPERDRQVVKQRAHALSASRRGAAPGPAAAFASKPPELSVPDDYGDSGALLASEFDESVDLAAAARDASATGILHAAELGLAQPEPYYQPPSEPSLLADEFGAGAPVPAASSPPVGGAPRAAAPAQAAPPATAQAPPAPEPEGDVSLDDLDALPETPSVAAGPQLAALGLGQKAQVARTTTDQHVLQALAYETSEDILLALLANPAINDRTAAIMARKASGRVAAEIYRVRRLFMRPLVRAAFLECPNAPSAALLEAVVSISDAGELLKVLKSPKVKFLEVKAKARARLANQFRGTGVSEKLNLIRRLGAPLIKELWTDFFRDEALVTACVEQQALDYGIILEIARSRVAPRKALEAIGSSRQWTSHYPICLELVLNPKTPRPVAQRLLQRLNPQDRAMVKHNAALPEALRRFA